MSLSNIETCIWMRTMLDWNRNKRTDLAELSHQLWDSKCDQIRRRPIMMIWCRSISISIRWFAMINRTLIITRSITGESTKNTRKILLILEDSITCDVVLNNKLFNIRSITLIYIMIHKRSINWCSHTNMIQIDN